MDSKEIDKEFRRGLKLWIDGKFQEGVDVLSHLAEYGHLDSISELFYIFLDQKDFDVAKYYIDCAKDQNEPTILYLKARLIEESDGINAAVESFIAAAEAGHSGAISLLFSWAVEERNIAQAEYYLEQLKGHEDRLSRMTVPETLSELRKQVDELRAQLSKIIPVYFVLASGRWIRARNEINERFEDEEVWENYLSENGFSTDEFELYEKWWISSAGISVIATLTNQFIEAIRKEVSQRDWEEMEEFLRNYANWDDFIRELSECTFEDAQSTGGPSYFAENAIENGLCDPVVSCPDFNQELITNRIEIWFKEHFDVAQSILLSAYDEIIKIRQ